MKIDQMLKREDFFEILQKTLNSYYKDIDFNIEEESANDGLKLYIYERLNAIISKNPSDEVKAFLKTEYSVKGSIFRKILVRLYLELMLNFKGRFSNKKKLYVIGKSTNEFDDFLIYPCNKKIRVFDFYNKKVEVITKYGFPSIAIKKEIEFRVRQKNFHIEPILNYGEDWYVERIIEGKPLARIIDNIEYNVYKRNALDILKAISAPYKTFKSSFDYKNELISEIKRKYNLLLKKDVNKETSLFTLLDLFNEGLSQYNKEVCLTLSHGDFHHGNIWIENKSKRIVLIDWETVGIRSDWYDVITLYGNLREPMGIKELVTDLHNHEVLNIIENNNESNIENIILMVLLEDLNFRINDLESTPLHIGIKEFENYCTELLNQISVILK